MMKIHGEIAANFGLFLFKYFYERTKTQCLVGRVEIWVTTVAPCTLSGL